MHNKQTLAAPLFLILIGAMCTPVSAQDEDAQAEAPKPSWVFNGKGQKTDQPELRILRDNKALYPINVNNYWGLMDDRGYVVVFPQFEWTDYTFDGFARYVQGGRTGFLRGSVADSNNPDEFFIQATYEYADRFSDGCAVVMDRDKWGMIDVSGRTLVPLEYDGVLRMQEGFAAVEKDGKIGFVNRAGRLKIPLQFKQARSFHNGYAAVQLRDNSWGYIDMRGKVVWRDTSGRVKELGDFHENYARIRAKMPAGDRWGYLSLRFRFQLEPRYEDARDFHDGLAAVKHEGKWGFVDVTGRWQIKPTFDDADDFDDAEGSNDFKGRDRVLDLRNRTERHTAGLYAMVKRGGRWGYINKADNAGLEPQFKEAEPFFRGLARVSRDASFAYVTETGSVAFDPRVAIKLGFVDLTAGEVARLGVAHQQAREAVIQQGGLTQTYPLNQGIANRDYPAPRFRKPIDVPYVAEHRYDEVLPRDPDRR